MTEFLLTRQPWVPVVTPTGTDTLGLIDLFECADSVMLAPNGPLEERTIHRLLLAISYTALGAPTEDEYPRRLDGARVARWLRDNENAFDLISTTAPFGQDATLADDEEHSHVVPIANIDSTVARSRPLLTDHRRADDVPPMPLADTVIPLLVYNAFDAPGIHEGVKNKKGGNLSMKGTEGATLAFITKGTLATSLTWAMIPTEVLGEPNWTYTGPGNIEALPHGELDSLTWFFRRLLLHHDGTHATGIQMQQGRIRKKPSQKVRPDTLPGQRNYVLSASDPKVTAATGEIGAPTSAGRGNPLNLIERWEAGSDTSLSGRVRAALAKNPDLTPPRITAIGQRLENTALKVLVREAEVPRIEGGLSEHTEALQDIRMHKRLFPSDDHRALAFLDIEDLAEVAAGLDSLEIKAPADDIEWPTHAQRLSGAPASSSSIPVPIPEIEGISDDILRDLAMVMEIENRKDTQPSQSLTLRRVRARLYQSPETRETLARTTLSHTPSADDLAPLNLPGLSAPQRLWAGLLAVAINNWRHAWDGHKPLPQALRQAGARLDFTQAQDTLLTATSAPDINALRAPLVTAIAMMARSRTAFSWWSLADDLENWSPPIRRAWKKAFFTKDTTANPTTEEED